MRLGDYKSLPKIEIRLSRVTVFKKKFFLGSHLWICVWDHEVTVQKHVSCTDAVIVRLKVFNKAILQQVFKPSSEIEDS